MKAASLPYRGPLVVLTPAEAGRLLELLAGQEDRLAVGVRRKCEIASESDARWRLPTS